MVYCKTVRLVRQMLLKLKIALEFLGHPVYNHGTWRLAVMFNKQDTSAQLAPGIEVSPIPVALNILGMYPGLRNAVNTSLSLTHNSDVLRHFFF